MSDPIPLSGARDNLADLVNRAHYSGERVTITKRGKPVAAIVSLADLEALEAFEENADIAAYDVAKQDDDGTRISLEQLRGERRGTGPE